METKIGNIVKNFEEKQAKVLQKHNVSIGSKVEIISKISDIRTQYFRGLVIAKCNKSIHSSFIVRRTVGSAAVEKRFNAYDPRIKKINVMSLGRVRQSKIYYLRNARGAAFKVKQK